MRRLCEKPNGMNMLFDFFLEDSSLQLRASSPVFLARRSAACFLLSLLFFRRALPYSKNMRRKKHKGNISRQVRDGLSRSRLRVLLWEVSD